MEQGHGSYQQRMEHSREKAQHRAVLVHNGRHAVGITGPDQNGLGVDMVDKIASQQAGDPLHQRGRHHIAQQHGPGVQRMGAGIAGGEHAEHNAEGGPIEAGPYQIVVPQNEQAEDAEVHQEHIVAQSTGNAGIALLVRHEGQVFFRRAAQGQGCQNGEAEENAAEAVGRQSGGNHQRNRRRCAGQGDAGGIEEDGLEHKGSHAHRQRGVIQVIALVDIGRMGQSRGNKETADHAYDHRHQKAPGTVAHNGVKGMPDDQVCNERGNAGGEEHGGDIVLHGLFLHRAVEHGAPDGGPDILDVDAPGTEARGQKNRQGCRGIQFRPERHIQPQAHQADHTHIEEGGAVAAHGKVVGRDLAGLAEDLPHPRKKPRPVRHKHRRQQKGSGKEAEKQP